MESENSYMNIDMLGDIYVIDEIIYYDKLLTFTCQNDVGNKFIASCTELDSEEQWLFLSISNARLTQVLRGGITAYEAFTKPEVGFLWKVYLQADDYSAGKAKRINVKELSEDDLPDKEIVFDIYGEELFTIKNTERQNIVSDSIKERRELLDLSLEMENSHVHEIEAEFLGEVLENTQKMINIIAHKKGVNGKVPQHIRDENKLIYSGDYAASFGLRLKSNKLANILNESELQESLTVFMNLLESKSDTNKIIEIINKLNPSVLQHYKSYLRMFERKNVSIKTYCAFPNKQYRNINVSTDDIEQSIKALDTEIVVNNKEKIFRGKLVAVDTTNNTFKFVTDIDEPLSGRIVSDLTIEEYRLPRQASAKFKIIVELNNFTQKEHITYELIELTYE
ncbi:hypothetical protein JSQ81_07680 [Sporosarcina sp. Marseille-Q4063]|uniref:DUF6575 domain-containing protein n=1 Tax=Sporosarcina sp. Marseille-Q4063 TaxID=2810514 RepID=UPI001BAE96C6|nr:DUF6575 domain-containing protein [Sporosarcina sp. Marseille-Q4063]QUW23393.1 hypothetical protein JSQ81_07680 [Sporosarcina sp. Marseille-Q4063]